MDHTDGGLRDAPAPLEGGSLNTALLGQSTDTPKCTSLPKFRAFTAGAQARTEDYSYALDNPS